MATFTPVTDIWTQGYDQVGRPCWQNKKTREIYYESSGHVPTQPYQAILPPSIGMAQGKGNGAVGSFTPAVDMWNRPCRLNEQARELYYDSVEGQPPAQPPRLLFTPTGPSPQSGPYFLPALPSHVEDLPPPKAGGKKKVDEEGQWYLRRNDEGGEYYLNTTTGQCQYETPDCLKKSTRGQRLPGYFSSNNG